MGGSIGIHVGVCVGELTRCRISRHGRTDRFSDPVCILYWVRNRFIVDWWVGKWWGGPQGGGVL